jgi:hypothetical protein
MWTVIYVVNMFLYTINDIAGNSYALFKDQKFINVKCDVVWGKERW